MRVKMLKEDDGYAKGVVYDLDDSEAHRLCEEGVARPMRETDREEATRGGPAR